MSNIVQINDENGDPKYYDFGTQNSSFLLTCKELKALGIKHWYQCLEVKNPHIGVQDIDPFDENLSKEDMGKIIIECKQNPWFFFREVARVPVRGAGSYRMCLTRASHAAVWCFLHGIDFMLCQPRQTYKSTWVTGITEYMFTFEFQNVSIPYMHIRQDRCLQNAEMLRDYICALPDYINPWYGRNKLPGTKSLKYESHNTSIAILSQADSEVKAKDKMRGMTLFACFLDEWEYIPYIDSVFEGATPAIISGREIMAGTGGRSCMMYASTPGDLNTSTGKAAQRMIDMTPRFTEDLYDFTQSELKNYFDGVTREDENGVPQPVTMLYIEFYYYQLRKDEKWLREQYNEAVRLNKMDEYRRGVLLDRFRSADDAIFTQEDMEYIQAHVRKPDHVIMLLKKYHLYVYDHKIDAPDITSDTPWFDINIPYLIGIDVATGKGGDNTTIVVANPYTLEVVAELASPWMGSLDLLKCIIEVARLIPRGVFCPEANSIGATVIDWVQESHLEYRFYRDPEHDLIKNAVVADDRDPETVLKQKANAKKYIGVTVTPKIRDTMFTLLKDYVHQYRHLFNTQMLVHDMEKLVVSKGKIQAEYGEHDDVVMAYNHILYVLTYGYDLTRYGIDKNKCTFLKSKEIMDNYEESLNEDHINNMLPYDQPTIYEEQLLQDLTNTARTYDHPGGTDRYGYKHSDYDYNGGLQTQETQHLTASQLKFFYEVNNF